MTYCYTSENSLDAEAAIDLQSPNLHTLTALYSHSGNKFSYSKRVKSKYSHLQQSRLCSIRFFIPKLIQPPYTGCPRMNGQNFGRVFLMLNYTDITQNTYIQSWTVTEIMAIEKCGLLGCPRTVRRPWRHTRPVRMPGNETPLANIVMQWPWRDNASAEACVNYLET